MLSPVLLALISLPCSFLLLIVGIVFRHVLRNRSFLAGPLRHVPVAPPTSRSLPFWLKPLLGDGDWGPIAALRGFGVESFRDKLIAARAVCGRIFLMRGPLGHPVVVALDTDAVRTLLIRKPYDVVKLPITNRLLAPLVGEEGLLLLEGDRHRQVRRKILPAMHHEAVAKFSSIFLEEGERIRKNFSVSVDRGEPLNLAHSIGKATCFTVIRSFFPRQLLSTERMETLRSCYASIFESIALIFRDVMLHQVLFFVPSKYTTRSGSEKRRIRTESCKLISEAEHISVRSPGILADDGSLVAHLLQVDKKDALSEKEQVDNLLTFLAAGQSTTAFSLSYSIWRLAKHPDWQTRIQTELDACEAWCDSKADPVVRVDAVCGITSLTCFVKESLRMHPPVIFTSRMLDSPMRLGDFDLAKGTIVSIPIYGLHMDPELWVAPRQFDPNRFLPEAEAARDKMAFIPFLHGPRGCIGKGFAIRELCVFVAQLLSSFSFSVLPGTPDPKPPGGGLLGYPQVDVFGQRRISRVV